MAVTYSWRLDTNKYAYLLPPDTITECTEKPIDFDTDKWMEYGFLSTVPLTDYFAKAVASKAEELFGKDNIESPLDDYREAFNVMYEKIKLSDTTKNSAGFSQTMGNKTEEFAWSGVSNYDLLSADEYFNVDAVSCVDLRGVGIKHVQYIGSIPCDSFYSEGGVDELTSPVDENNNIRGIVLKGGKVTVNYINEEGNPDSKEIIVRQGILGFSDIYGIYMDDQANKDGEINETTVPEKFFIVRNGKNGMKGNNGDKGDKGEPGKNANTNIEELQASVQQLTDQVENIISALEKLMSCGYGEWESWTNPIQSLATNVESVKTQVEDLSTRVSTLESNGIGGGSGSGSGSIEIYQMRNGTNANNIQINNDFVSYGPNASDTYKFNEDKTIYLLGYYPTSDGNDGVDAASRLFAIPNIAISSKGISIKGNINVIGDGVNSGKINAQEVYAEDGFYNTNLDEKDLPSSEISIYKDNTNN